MKGRFIMAFPLVFFALSYGSVLCAQQTRPNGSAQRVLEARINSALLIREMHRPSPVLKNNFTHFTRKYTNRGKLWMAKNAAYLHHPDANFIDEYIPNSQAVELFEKRTIDTKFYINKDSSSICYSQRSSGPMHFKRNGQWITIDTRLSPKGQLIYEASYQEDPLGFDIKRKSSYISTADGKTYFNHWTLYGDNGNGESLLATADWTNYTVGDNGMEIKNIFPGIDAEMTVSKGSIKTSFIVHANKFSSYKKLLFRDSFLNGHSGHFSFSHGLTGNGLASAADFRVGAATVFHIKEGVMYQKEKPSSTHQFIPYYLDQNKLTLSIDGDFLNTQIKTGDVIIDPLVQDVGTLAMNMITGSHSNQDCSMDTACQYDFTVPAPPGATLTDAMFSFEFTANAPCVRQDGAFSFTINGSCVSQKYAGTDSVTGPLTFPNQSIILNNGGSVASCLPAPVCGAQNIPFSFYFFRNCNGPNGCDGSCIGATKDLVITLVGRTFDSASLIVSQPSLCAGAPVTLTARGFYGVAPYNFTWQGLSQFNGDSIIHVNPTANTVYSVQVSGACADPGSPPITKSVNVTVTKPPTPVLTSNSPVCTGGQLILSVPAVTGTTYTIKNTVTGLGGGPFTSTAVFNNVTTAYSGKWFAVATDASGCISDTGTTTVIVNPIVSPTASISATATSICAGSLVVFTAAATNAGTSPTYQWMLNGQKVGTNSLVYSSSSFSNNDAISCVVTSSVPCATGPVTSNVIVLHVNPMVTPTFNTIGPLCQNSTAPILPLTSKEGITGTWSPATINTSVAGTVTYTFTPSTGLCATPTSLSITTFSSFTPIFDPIGPLCQNSTPPTLPPTSKEGIPGTWSPATISTSAVGTVTYHFTPSSTGNCAVPTSINVTIASNISPTFPTVANSYCQNTTAPALPTTSKEGITGTWNPASINTSALGNTTYTFTPTAGSCASPASLIVTITTTLTPTFDAIGPLCQNSAAPALPLSSKEGIAGTWSPASINTSALGTSTYHFTPSSAGNCAVPTSINVTIVANVSPTFPTIANSYCQNSTAPALPTTSKEGITGIWNPASINTSALGTTTYTFTPTAGVCATPVSLIVNIVSNLTPVFDPIGPLCQNSTPPQLPPVSKEGTPGTWSPASINTSALGTTTYHFTPSSTGNCTVPVSMNVTIVSIVTPTFPTTAVSYCQNTTAPALPTTSKEGITGTWNPASINTSALGTTTYTFTPSAGTCAIPASLNITIVSSLSPTFDAIGPLCQNSTSPVLPLTSKEGIAGTWSPASINTSAPGTSTYHFTPSSVNSCAIPASLSVTVVANVTPTFPTIAASYCQNSTAPVLPAASNEGITGTWSPASINTSALGNAVYTFTPSAGSCATSVSLSIAIVSSISPIFDPIGPLCQNSTPPLLPSISKEGIAGTWSPASINTSILGTETYTFTPSSAGNCVVPASMNITIVNNISPTFPTIAASYCQNSTAPALPAKSQEGITGTWSPASINTSALGTVTYTFTPSAGSCAVPASLDVTIVTTLTPTFDGVGPLCLNSAPPPLPTTSKEGITGTWSPASINTSAVGTQTYHFTPTSPGTCAVPTSIDITIATTISPTFPTLADSYCLNETAPALPTVSKEGIKGTWTPSSISTETVGSTEYTFTPTGSGCGVPSQITIVVNAPPVLTMEPDKTIAEGASTQLNVSVTGNIVSYLWTPSTGLNNATIEDPVASPSTTTRYTLVVIDENHCEASGSIQVTISGRAWDPLESTCRHASLSIL